MCLRKESLNLFLALVKMNSGSFKNFLVDNYNLVSSLVHLLMLETVPQLLLKELMLLNYCFLKDTEYLEYDPKDSECEANDVNLGFLN